MTIVVIDEFGRISLPLEIRSQLGLQTNEPLSLEINNGQLVLRPIPIEPELEYQDGVLVVKSSAINNLETIIDQERETRINELLSW
ncbi:MAG: AbrB/MazE/SpoVT family DNA-binding domain-containing protein [Prochloraceae cyanobacterium]